MLDPGTCLHERYVIEAVIGSGATGHVYRAVDTRLGRLVALKILEAPDEEDAAKTAAAALREARAGAGIHHVNVAAIFDVDQVDQRPFIVMELVSGASLRDYIGKEGPLATRLRWLADVASALDAAHQLGVVHRDVKPENVVVGDDGRVKVLDFGVARRAVSAITISVEGALGTPAYLAPEQIRGERADARTDQFSWGTVAYELLAGRLPWKGTAHPVTLLASILRDTPPPFAPELGIPAEVEAAVRRALAAEPASRFPSMGEVSAALTPFAAPPLLLPGTPAGPPVSLAAPSPTHTSVRPPRLRRTSPRSKRRFRSRPSFSSPSFSSRTSRRRSTSRRGSRCSRRGRRARGWSSRTSCGRGRRSCPRASCSRGRACRSGGMSPSATTRWRRTCAF